MLRTALDKLGRLDILTDIASFSEVLFLLR